MSLLKVGDPKQLPATVMSGLASKFLYECSMFERLQRAGYPVIMLTKQVICYYLLSHFAILLQCRSRVSKRGRSLTSIKTKKHLHGWEC